MKFRVERDPFADAVAWSARSLPARPALPLLAGLSLQVSDDQLSVSGFDYEVSTEATLDVQSTAGGRALVSGRLLAEISRSLPGQPVDIHLDGARLILSCGSARFALPTMPIMDYPELPGLPPLSGAVGSDVFAAAVAAVAIAAGRDDTLPVLTGVRLEIEGSQLTLAATDRYRLAVRTLPWQPNGSVESAAALVPARTLSDTAKALTSGAQIGVALATGAGGEGLIGFEGGGRRATTRLLDGVFPKYRTLLPAESTSVARIETAPFVESVRRVALVAQRTAPVRLAFGSGEVVLEAGSGDDAQASEVLPASFDAEPLTIAFNPTFLLDGLGAIDSDQVTVLFTSPTKPAVLTGKDPEVYRYLLMPVRLTD